MADGRILGQSRDITLGNLRVPAAQYDARKKTLKVLNSVDVTVKFEGGSHAFSDQLASPWEQSQRKLARSLLNPDVVRGDRPVILERCGEEMLVITDPSAITAANTFANARRVAGIRTSVVQTGAGPGQIGTTPGQIQTFIRSRLTAPGCIIRATSRSWATTSWSPRSRASAASSQTSSTRCGITPTSSRTWR